VITLATYFAGQLTSHRFSAVQLIDHLAKIIFWAPSELIARLLVHIDPVDGGKHAPIMALIECLKLRHLLADDCGGIRSKISEVSPLKRRCRADDITAKANLRRPLKRAKMRAHSIFEVDPAKQKLIGFHVFAGEHFSDFTAIFFFGKEPRRSQDNARKVLLSVKQLAEILGRGFGHAINIFRDRLHILGNPGGGRPLGRNECGAESAGRTGEDEAPDACLRRFLRQIERAGDIGVDEILPGMARDMGLVQCRGMNHGIGCGDTVPDEASVNDRADFMGKLRVQNIHADGLVTGGLNAANQRFTQVTRTTGDQDFYGPTLSLAGPYYRLNTKLI
jgi:hypothetical protein